MARLLWQQRQDIGPAARLGAAMIYMPPTGKTLLWGGAQEVSGGSLEPLGDTWEWDGDGWVQVADMGPAPLLFAGMALDSTRDVVVLFTQNPAGTVWETWEWDGEGWTQVEDTGPNAAQSAFQIVYDSARQVTILEGGSVASGSGTYIPVGTWQWDGTTWTQVADVGPPARVLCGLGYDATRGRVVLFGGLNLDSTLEPDTWEWDGNEWEQITNVGPPPRYGHAVTGTSGATLAFGGVRTAAGLTSTALLRDTWTWDGSFWHQRQNMGPAPRAAHALSWDAAKQRGVLFGGLTILPSQTTNTYLGDTWESFEAP
jgi:Galactose oxidase, central domain